MNIIAVFVSIVTVYAVAKSARVLNFVIKQCDKTDTFLQFFGGSLLKCTEECDRRSRCTYIMFMQRMNHCSLKGNVSGIKGNESNVIEHLCMFLEKKDWIPSDLGPCNENTCNVTETCVSSKDDPKQFSCLKSTCPSPPVVVNAALMSDISTIGSTNRYKCKNGYKSFGTPSTTCTSTATWNESGNFWCEPNCRTPASSYTNAVLSRVEYSGLFLFERKVVIFTCKKDYQALGPTATSTCGRNGEWNYKRVQCCENGTYNKPWIGRCVFYTEPLQYYGQFAKTCSARGYARTNFHALLSRYMLISHSIDKILMPVKKSDFERTYNLTECFRMNKNITAGNFTFDEKIQFARSNNMTQGACEPVTWWAPSEPNGDTGENCLMRKNSEGDFPLYDIPCSNLIDFNIRAVCHSDLPII
ncbi:uncharacterized protein LOC132742830 [Ruditapes philippinarum]|uniref:uncharacterized protein LOC132742830 n=1 Tax=Ruditapes philippinarum TaxID=129788 RepID=UPI00295B2D2E|nr:uncharacterized protein LOC132742830 [Ruditapes philippinarum]